MIAISTHVKRQVSKSWKKKIKTKTKEERKVCTLQTQNRLIVINKEKNDISHGKTNNAHHKANVISLLVLNNKLDY